MSSSRPSDGVQRADADVRLLGLLPAEARLVLGDGPRELLHQLVVDLVEDVDALAAEAHLAAVPEAADGDAARGGLDVGVGGDDHGVRAAELHRHALQLRRGQAHDVAADRGRAGERHAADLVVGDERVADLRAAAGDRR